MSHSTEPLEVVSRVLALTEEQALAVEAGDWQRFHALLAQREQVMSVPDLANEILGGTSEQRAQIMAMLARIEWLDASHRDAILRERYAVLQELPGLEQGRRAAAAYRDSGITSAAYVDTSS